MPKVTIDGKEIEFEKGQTVIQVADKAGIDIPRYCYHPGLPVAGNCRICLVDVEKNPKLQIACNTQCGDGMVVSTQNEKVKQNRAHVLEFLLINHPLDCPVCDQAGECQLQNYYMDYGLYDARFDEDKVKKGKKGVAIGPTVMLDNERCILCSRCERFTDHVTGTHEFGIFNRGDHSEIGLYPGKTLDNPYSGNVVDICPVGALTDKDFRFKLRVWYLDETPSVCNGCSTGCNIELHTNRERTHHAAGERLMRLKPRENQAVNQWWMCDEGRYGYKFADQDRVQGPAVIRKGEQEPADWLEALQQVKDAFKKIPAKEWLVLASPQLTNEELYLIKKLFQDKQGAKVALLKAKPDGEKDNILRQADKNPNMRGGLLAGLAEFDPAVHVPQKGLFAFGQDLDLILGKEKAAEYLNRAETVVFQGSNWNDTARRAHIVLPAAVYAEKEGTFTNFQGRVQRIFRALTPKSEARPDWAVLADIAHGAGLEWTYTSPEEIFKEMSAKIKAFQGMTYETLGKQGALIS